MPDADVSFVVSTVGFVIPFALTENTGVSDVYGTAIFSPISYAQSATVTWINAQGVHRVLSLSSPPSAIFTYTLSAFDYQSPKRELGQLQVSVGGTVFWTSTFSVNITAHI